MDGWMNVLVGWLVYERKKTYRLKYITVNKRVVYIALVPLTFFGLNDVDNVCND